MKKVLYLSTHPESWGDGIMNSSFLRAFKISHPDTSVIMACHSSITDAISPVLLFEGVVDYIISIPDELVGPTQEIASEHLFQFLDFLFHRLGTINYDWVIFSWVYDNVKEILSLDVLRNAQITSHPSSYNLYEKQIPDIVKPLDVIDGRWEDSRFHTLLDRQCMVNDYISQRVDESKENIGMFLSSTRKMAEISYEVTASIIEMLNKTYNVILIGADSPTWLTKDLKEWDSGILKLRDSGLDFIDTLGMGAIKQLDILPLCQSVIILPTGAVVLPILKDSNIILLSGGESSSVRDILTNLQRSFSLVETDCEFFPCENVDQDKCTDSPKCFGEEFNYSKFQEVLYNIEALPS